MKSNLQNLTLSLTAVATLACGTENVTFDDEATSSDAASTEVCATGLDPNYVSNTLTNVGATATYVRSEAWINDICPDPSRATTIVDYPVPGYYQHQIPETYRFVVQPAFWESASTGWSNAAQAQADCANTTMAVRMQRWSWASSSWVQLTYQETSGVWVWDNIFSGVGHCNEPIFNYLRENYGTAQQVETNKYRVRTWAKQPDGSFATVWITGTHTGIY